MNSIYEEIPANEAYSLQNPGGVIFLCTRSSVPEGASRVDSVSRADAASQPNSASRKARYNFAPLAWCTPYEYDPVSKILLVCDTSHKTFSDIQENSEFAIALPSFDMRDLVEQAGSVSGFAVDKFAQFSVQYIESKSIDVRIPAGVVGWMECTLERIVIEGTSGIVFGAVRQAFAEPDAWSRRIHYVDDETWYRPGERL